MHSAYLLTLSAITVVALFAASAIYWFERPLLQYPDQSIYIVMAEQLLNGKRLYVDVIDFNPPLITYINTLPVLLGRAFHLPLTLSFNIFTLGLMLVSMILSGCLMFQHRRGRDSFFYLPVLIGFLLLCREHRVDFGQREHLLVITYLPFLILRHFRWQGLQINKNLATICGLFAATCISFKPQFLLMAMAPELVYFLEKRNWKAFLKPEIFACAGFGIAYGAHFAFLDEQTKQQFFNFVVPLVTGGYDYYQASVVRLLCCEQSFAAMATIIAAFAMSRHCSLLMPIAAYTAASLSIYVLAAQDWSHHLVPVEFGTRLLVCLEAAVIIRYLCSYSQSMRLLNIHMTLLLTALGAVLFAFTTRAVPVEENKIDLSTLGYSGYSAYDDVGVWSDVITKYSEKGDPVLCISDAIAPGYPAVLQLERTPGSRYLHGMPLMLAKYLCFEKLHVKDRALFLTFYERIINDYQQDIGAFRPKLLIIRKSAILDALNKSEFFKKLNDYELKETFEGHLIYQRK